MPVTLLRMLPRPHRLAPRANLRVVLRRGVALRGAGLFLRVLFTGRPVSRFACVVSTKVAKNATVRNRQRRQASEIIRLMLPQLRPGYDVVVSLQPGRRLTGPELTGALRWALRRTRLLPPDA